MWLLWKQLQYVKEKWDQKEKKPEHNTHGCEGFLPIPFQFDESIHARLSQTP